MFTKQQNGSLNNNNNNNNYEMQKDLLLIIDAEIQNTKVEKTTTSTKLLLCFVLTSCSEQRSMARGITIH